MKITDEMVQLFRRGIGLRDAGKPRREEFRDVSAQLHRALGLKPWHESPLQIVGDEPPNWMRNLPEQRADWQAALSLRRRLEAAIG